LRLRSSIFILALLAGPAAAAPRTFDLVTYTTPDGWNVDESRRDLVSLSHATTTSYCMVSIYAGTPAVGDLEACFAAEWKGVMLRTIDEVAAPAVTQGTVGNTRAALGGTPATIKGAPAVAMLTVLDAGASVVSIVTLASSMPAFEGCNPDLQRLLGGLTVRRVDAAPAGDGKLVVPRPTRALTLADLAGEWKHEDRISTTYVDRNTGAYAGSDNLAFREGWTITSKGAVTSDFFAIRNGKKILEKTAGTIAVLPNAILEVRVGSPAQYVIRGWLETPGLTVLKIVGPFYLPEGVTPEHLGDTDKGSNLSQYWIRKKPIK
jgi:hypothetical protein